MKKFLLSLCLLISCYLLNAQDVTMLSTSFEASEGYTTSSIHSQKKWKLSSGSGVVSTSAFKTGSNGLELSATSGTLQLDYEGYSKSETGLSDIVYVDLFINVQNLSGGNFQIATYDYTPNSSSKRASLIEFLNPSNNKGNIKVYNGSSGSNKGQFNLNAWHRLSLQIDMESDSFKIAIDGVLVDGSFNLRETWNPADLGRPSGKKEIHSLRFSNSSASTSSEIFIDDVYVGQSPIPDVSFGELSTSRTVTIETLPIGYITIEPEAASYNLDDTLMFTCHFPTGYKLAGWTGSLSGTDNPIKHVLKTNITVGADVIIDTDNPPAKFTLTINQPTNGTITVNPPSSDNTYYANTQVSVELSHPPCYIFQSWTGDLSGNAYKQSFSVDSDMTIGALISADTTNPIKRVVKNATEFKNALNAMNPGDTIEVQDGTYSIGNCVVTRSGCSDRPIFIKAQNRGQAKLIDQSSFTLRHVEHITIEGFVFESSNVTAVKTESARYCRITRNVFRLNETTSNKWILIGGYYRDSILQTWHNRIDYNLFENKTQAGNYITIDGCTYSGEQSRYDVIAFNHFRNLTPRAVNEKEAVRVGVTQLTQSSGYTTIEYNLFEDCDGDPEIVSIKSCDNIIRYNTFRRCLGTLSLRQGFRNIAEGNYFFGEGKIIDGNGCGGIRVYGKDHIIINNYFEGLTGEKWDPAFALTNGDVTNSSTSYSSHFLPENVIFAFNTLVNNKSDIEIGFTNNGNYGKAPINCMIENNIIINDTNPIVKVHATPSRQGVAFRNNMFYPTGQSSMGISYTDAEIKNINPQLVKTDCANSDCSEKLPTAVFKLNANSPAIDAMPNIPSYLEKDFEGQLRSGQADLGCDEYNDEAVLISVLLPIHVGPDAIPFASEGSSGIRERNASRSDLDAYYSPSSQTITVRIQSPAAEKATLRLINLNGQTLLKSTCFLDEGFNQQDIPLRNVNKGLYILILDSPSLQKHTKIGVF